MKGLINRLGIPPPLELRRLGANLIIMVHWCYQILLGFANTIKPTSKLLTDITRGHPNKIYKQHLAALFVLLLVTLILETVFLPIPISRHLHVTVSLIEEISF